PNPVPSGDVLQLGLSWLASGQAPGNEKVFTHVIDGQGNIWAQRDGDPAGGAKPTGSWTPGDKIDDKYGLLVLPGTPPGGYQAEVGMYDPNNGKRQAITEGGEGDRLLLGSVQVGPAPRPPSLEELSIPHALNQPFGLVRLLGYGLTLVGQDQQRDRFSAGDEVELTLFWQADGVLPGDSALAITLGSAVLSQGALIPAHPTATWAAGDRYRDQHRLRIPDVAHGKQPIALRLDGGAAVALAAIEVA
ncbi:MAG: hypothetical protein JOZ39_00855, partial [Chloroflexi bacterium]|nr:hypothetical protein [Chloroflexota bacterium]